MNREENRAANKARREKPEEYWLSEAGDNQAEAELPADWLTYADAIRLLGKSEQFLSYRRDAGYFRVYRVPQRLLPKPTTYRYPSELQRLRTTNANRNYTRGAWAVSKAEILGLLKEAENG